MTVKTAKHQGAISYEAFDVDDIVEDEQNVEETPRIQSDYDPLAENRVRRIADSENEYQSRRRKLVISPCRYDPFAEGGVTPAASSERRTFARVMTENEQNMQKKALTEQLKTKLKDGTLKANPSAIAPTQPTKKRRWDQTPSSSPQAKKCHFDEAATPSVARWNETPVVSKGEETPAAQNIWEATPAHATPGAETPGRISQATPSARRNRWDETPRAGETPSHVEGCPEVRNPSKIEPGASVRKSRWDETPANATPCISGGMNTPGFLTPMSSSTGGATPVAFTPSAATPMGVKAMAMATPGPAFAGLMTPEQKQAWTINREVDERNRPLTDEEIDALLPPGFKILSPPSTYVSITPSRKLLATPTPASASQTGFMMQTPNVKSHVVDLQPPDANLPLIKPDDMQYFDQLLVDVNEESLSIEEQKKRTIMKLLLKLKNGTPPMRKAALRQITNKAQEFGAKSLFDQILPLFMNPQLEDQERHLLVKVLGRILYKLDDLVRPYVHNILVVAEPLLIDKDYYTRIEGREIISNLAKAVGSAWMFATLRPDISHMDEYIRNSTARTFAIVASTFGVSSVIGFIKAVCMCKKSWQAKHTGIKTIQQIAILIGCSVLPHIGDLIEIIKNGLSDENQKIRTITALAIAALAEAATPYGIESFEDVLKPLWEGIRIHRGKGLSSFLKAIGCIIPLMDAELSCYYVKEVMLILVREFQSPDEEMKMIVLKAVKQCCAAEGVEKTYIKENVLPPYFRCFWNQRIAMDRLHYMQAVDTTVEIANKVGASEIVRRIVNDLKDDSEPYRKMAMETIEKVVTNVGSADIDPKLEELLIDGLIHAFQEQTSDDRTIINGIAGVVNALGTRTKPYIAQIVAIIKWRCNSKVAKSREHAADLAARIAPVVMRCGEESTLIFLGHILFEYLGEEYPEVLGSILGALKSIVSVVGMSKMSPPIKDLLPRLTPILKNRHEKVQENCIDLVGRIADRGAEYVAAREWMRICFELLELLKANKKAIRRAAVNTFGYIAKAIGPHDVLATLLNNLKVQERQNRVCTTVAIAIVAETCAPFTVLPALMNEYRVPEMNVQNGVLKSLSFLFEYIGEMSKDYVYAITPLLEDALMDRDLVHRQTAMSAVGHLAIGVQGLGCDDALTHLMNFVWPNIFETSAHVRLAFMSAVEGMRIALGPTKILQHLVQGLYHPARKVRETYWRLYNSLYVGSQDALIPAYPRISDDAENGYIRHELDYLICS